MKMDLRVRMNRALGDQLREAAKHNNVSQNSEIVRRLEASFREKCLVERLAEAVRREIRNEGIPL